MYRVRLTTFVGELMKQTKRKIHTRKVLPYKIRNISHKALFITFVMLLETDSEDFVHKH